MTHEIDTVTAKSKLQEAIHDVREYLTAAEASFLHALLIDPPEAISNDNIDMRVEHMNRATRRLNDDMLFASVVDVTALEPLEPSQQQTPPPTSNQQSILGLWKAFAHGIFPKDLIKRSNNSCLPQSASSQQEQEDTQTRISDVVVEEIRSNALTAPATTKKTPTVNPPDEKTLREVDETEVRSFSSDEELRPVVENDDIEQSDGSSWGEDDHVEHYDAWDIMKDEYAADFGFDFDPNSHPAAADVDDNDDQNVFLILGTSADDKSCQPHVLSPPLMDSLMNFIPTQLHNENFWLKFSLVRDGASLHTLKQYTRAATHSILAVETTQGQVFGSFTSSPWRNTRGFYGTPPAFVWRMRHGRRSKVASLFDQALLESEIDIFMYNADATVSDELNDDNAASAACTESHVQICRTDLLAVGGDYYDDALCAVNDDISHSTSVDLPPIELDRSGFALTLNGDLSTGTTSPCRTFKSPALCGEGDITETFSIAGLEVWTFTPARDVDSAERLEMTKFFIEQCSSRSVSEVDPTTSSTSRYTGSPKSFSSRDLIQKEFYRRAGDDMESEE